MYSGNFDLLSTCRDLSSPVFFKRRNQKQVVIGGIAVVFELMGIILAGFSYVLYVVLPIFLVLLLLDRLS